MKRKSDKQVHRLEKKIKKAKALLTLLESKRKVGKNDNETSSDKNIDNELNEKLDHDEILANLKKYRKELQSKVKERTVFSLNDLGKSARAKDGDFILPLQFVNDLIIGAFDLGHKDFEFGQIQRITNSEKVIVFILDNIDIEFTDLEAESFNEVLKFSKENEYINKNNSSWVEELLLVNLKFRQKKFNENFISQYKNSTKINRLQLLLSAEQMFAAGYPLSEVIVFNDDDYNRFKGKHTVQKYNFRLIDANNENIKKEQVLPIFFKTTKKHYKPVTRNSPMFALDCEMCLTKIGPVVTFIGVVDEHNKTLLHTYVKPSEKITDYLTQFSGITPEKLENVTTTLADVHRKLDEILPEDAILCGHSLENDLLALRLIHPYIIDTSIIYNLSGIRSVRSKLKQLSSLFLSELIQFGKTEHAHDPVEDALASMKLVNLKLERGFEFGDALLNKNNILKKFTSIANYSEMKKKRVQVYYDYIPFEQSNRMLFVFSRINSKIKEEISRYLSMDKCFCIVITNNGLCCVRC